MSFNHYVVDWFYWYNPTCITIDCIDRGLSQTWNLYKTEYPDFKTSYDEYFEYE